MGVPRDFSASALFVSLNVGNFAILRLKLVYSFLNRIRLSSTSLICTLFNSVHFNNCKLKEEWDKILQNKLSIMTTTSLYIVYICANCILWNLSDNKVNLILHPHLCHGYICGLSVNEEYSQAVPVLV